MNNLSHQSGEDFDLLYLADLAEDDIQLASNDNFNLMPFGDVEVDDDGSSQHLNLERLAESGAYTDTIGMKAASDDTDPEADMAIPDAPVITNRADLKDKGLDDRWCHSYSQMFRQRMRTTLLEFAESLKKKSAKSE